MFHQKFDGASMPLLTPSVAAGVSEPLLAGASTITVAEALISERFVVGWRSPPSAEASGDVLLSTADFCRVSNQHLEAVRVRLLQVPSDETAMLERINWMWHAGSRRDCGEKASRAHEAIDVMIGQVAPNGEFDPEWLAEGLSSLQADHPEVIAALFIGDLDDVPLLIEAAIRHGADKGELVRLAAWMFVC